MEAGGEQLGRLRAMKLRNEADMHYILNCWWFKYVKQCGFVLEVFSGFDFVRSMVFHQTSRKKQPRL